MYSFPLCYYVQTWDLLRIMMHGFKEDFTTDHQGYYVHPNRLNGSAVKTLFGQLKHTTGGNLSGANYTTGKATLLRLKEKMDLGTAQLSCIYGRQN